MNISDQGKESSIARADRGRGAIWGQFIGDAACLGAHWIYDLDELAGIFPQGVSGFEAPAEGHYHAGKRSGDFTHYGDAALLMLRSVAKTGRFSAQDFGTRFVALFSSPGYRGYRDHATKATLENYRAFIESSPGSVYPFQGGADDDQPATATRIAPLVVQAAGDESLLRQVESATRVCQDNGRAVAYLKCHALIIRELLAGSTLADACKAAALAVAGDPSYGREIAAVVEEVFGRRELGVREATLQFGQSCPLRSSFPAALHCALRHEDDFSRAILETANAGGDSAARAAMIGTWLGARYGMQAIPAAWRDRLNDREEIGRCIEAIVAR